MSDGFTADSAPRLPEVGVELDYPFEQDFELALTEWYLNVTAR